VLDRRLAPTTTGEDIRIRFLVYDGNPPSGDEEADRILQFWTSVLSEE